MTQSNKTEYLFKVLVIGEIGAGKTSIIKQYVHKMFSDHYSSTLGVDFASKVLTWRDNCIIRLQLWDIGGQERFGAMTRVYYKEAVGCIIVYDSNKHSSFAMVEKWKKDIDEKVQLSDGTPIPCILLANKCDQLKAYQNTELDQLDLSNYCKDHGFIAWFETSAKNNINIDESVSFLIEKILENIKDLAKHSKRPIDIIQPSIYDKTPKATSSNCCS